jgi:transposase
MTQFSKFVGIDLASISFMAWAGSAPWKLVVKPVKFNHHEAAVASFLVWLKERDLKPENTVVCMAATGGYRAGLASFLSASGYSVAVEPPLNMVRKFPANASQPDELDCQYIAKLAFWQPTRMRYRRSSVKKNLIRSGEAGARSSYQANRQPKRGS